MWRLLLIFSLCIVFESSHADYVDSYYCGEDNCYDLLQITRDATKAEVKRAFRSTAAKTHPDRFRDPDEKEKAESRFQVIQTAYDILRDDEARADYDFMLDNPEQFYQNYYRAWRRRNLSVDIRIVIAVTISLISLVQYYNGWTKYEEAIKHFTTTPKYRLQAIEIARQDGLLEEEKSKKKQRGMTKEEIRHKEETIIREVIESKMDIRGVYAKPTYTDILWVQLVYLPYWIALYIKWYLRWVWKFWIKKDEYEDEEKLHLIRKNLGISQGQMDALEEETKEEYLELELWIKDIFSEWKTERDEENRKKNVQSGRYKAYRRYMKSNGPGRMYFDDS